MFTQLKRSYRYFYKPGKFSLKIWVSYLAHSISFISMDLRQFLFLFDFPGGSDGKVSVYNAGDPGSNPGLGRSPGEGNGNPLQYYCLENAMDREAWKATVYGVAKSRTRLSDITFTLVLFSLLIPKMSMFTLTISCLTTSNLL